MADDPPMTWLGHMPMAPVRFVRSAPVEVCFECDIADCRHIRARRELAADPDPNLINQLIHTGRAEQP